MIIHSDQRVTYAAEAIAKCIFFAMQRRTLAQDTWEATRDGEGGGPLSAGGDEELRPEAPVEVRAANRRL